MKLYTRAKNWIRGSRWRLPCACYTVFLAGWLVLAAACFCIDRLMPQTLLESAAAELIGLEAQPDGGLLTQGADPQLVYPVVDVPARRVLLEADFQRAPGEMELFYTRKAGPGFSVRRRVIGVPVDGGYLYTLPPGRVYGLRLDAGQMGDNGVDIGAITLNPRLGAAHYFVPTLRGLAAFAVWPALACCAFYTIMEGARFVRGFIKSKQRGNA